MISKKLQAKLDKPIGAASVQKMLTGMIICFMLGLLIGNLIYYNTTSKPEMLHNNYLACLDGCDYSDLPDTRLTSCELFCTNKYVASHIEEHIYETNKVSNWHPNKK